MAMMENPNRKVMSSHMQRSVQGRITNTKEASVVEKVQVKNDLLELWKVRIFHS